MGQREALDTGQGLSMRQKGASSLPDRGRLVTQIPEGVSFCIFSSLSLIGSQLCPQLALPSMLNENQEESTAILSVMETCICSQEWKQMRQTSGQIHISLPCSAAFQGSPLLLREGSRKSLSNRLSAPSGPVSSRHSLLIPELSPWLLLTGLGTCFIASLIFPIPANL